MTDRPTDRPTDLPNGLHNDQPNEFGATEEQLRDSMRSQADGFEPSPDSFVRLEQRLAQTQASHDGSQFGPRLMAMAAGLVLVVGVAGYLSFRPAAHEIATSSPTTEPSADESAEASQIQPDDGSATANTVQEGSSQFDVVSGNIAGPKADSPLEAASAFLSLIRVEDDFELGLGDSSNEVKVFAETDTGVRSSLATTLTIAMTESSSTMGTSYFVVSASSDSVQLEGLPDTRITASGVSVRGVSTGWADGSASIRLYSSNDGVLLESQQITVAASSLNTEFTSDLSLTGRDHGWVVVDAGAQAGDSIGSFGAVPIFFDSPQVEYTVAHVDVDDPDGLHVRHLPGTDGEIVDSLAPGTTSVFRRGVVPSLGTTGPYEWWPITYADGKLGWVNARYLAAVEPVTDEELEAAASWFIEALQGSLAADGLVAGREFWPDERYKPVQVGWIQAMTSLSGDELASLSTWDDEIREWQIPADYDPDYDLNSLRGFLEFGDVELTVDTTDHRWVYGNDQQAAESNFAGLSNVTIAQPFDELTASPTAITLYVEQTESGPVIVGIALWIWVP